VAPGGGVTPARRWQGNRGVLESGGAWRRGVSRQAMVTKSVVSWSTSAWQYELFRRAVVNEFEILRRLVPGGTCPPPGGLEADNV